MIDYQLLDDDEVPEGKVIAEDGWAIKIQDVIVDIQYVQFADEPNPDGTYGVHIEYELVEGEPEDVDDFNQILVEVVIDALEEATKWKEVKDTVERGKLVKDSLENERQTDDNS